MCCKRDEKLTAKYRRKRKPFPAWRCYHRKDNGTLDSGFRRCRSGGTVAAPGAIVSNRERGGPADEGALVYSGIHWFLTRDAADTFAKGRTVVKVMVEPADVAAVGDYWMDGGSDKVCDYYRSISIPCPDVPVGVSTKVTISKEEFEKAVGRTSCP